MQNIKFWVIVIIISFSGCASLSNGTKPPTFISGKSVIFINDSLINYPKASGSIRNVDDKIISTFWTVPQSNMVEVVPGNHEISIAFYSKGYSADAKVKALFKSGRVYEISATLNGGAKYKVLLMDVTDKESKLISENEVWGKRSP